MTLTSKRSLNLALSEPFVVLRTANDTGSHRRRRQIATGDSASMLRGVLSFKLSKPMRITSIEVEFTGESRTEWPEGESQENAPHRDRQRSHSLNDRNRLTTHRIIRAKYLP
jgi:hypothetical protein